MKILIALILGLVFAGVASARDIDDDALLVRSVENIGVLPLLAACPLGHQRTVPFRLLRTSETDRTPLYGRPFKCRTCGSPEVILSAIESQAELEAIQRATPG
jgi:hypothetical protein